MIRKDPGRIAWLVLLAAFSVFCTLLIGIPLTARWYVISATVAHEAELEAIMGTVLVYQPGATTPIGVTASATVPEGSTIRTDDSSRAFITLFDKSTITLSFGSEARLGTMRSPRFSLSDRHDAVELELLRGQANIGVALPLNSPVDFRVTSPHMGAQLNEGSYSIKVTEDSSRTTVHLGSAQVSARGETVSLAQRETAMVTEGQPPGEPVAGAQNLLVNGNFVQDLSAGWQAYNEQGGDGGDIDGQISVLELPESNSRAVKFSRLLSGGNHCQTVLRQDLNEEVADIATSLSIYLKVKLEHQSLSGGGYLSSEYPLMVRLEYEDVYGSPGNWTHGFYYQNENNNPTMYGERIPRNVWFDYESGDILEAMDPRPARLTALLVYASGWDYESQVTDISLVVE